MPIHMHICAVLYSWDCPFPPAGYCSRLFYFDFIYVDLSFMFQWCFFFPILCWDASRENICYEGRVGLVRGYGVLAHFGLSITRWSLCEPHGSSYSSQTHELATITLTWAAPRSTRSLWSAPYSSCSLSIFFARSIDVL